MKRKNNIEDRWKDFIDSIKQNGDASLGKCNVLLTLTEDGHPTILLNDSYGSGFQLMLPEEMAEDSKAALMLYHEGAKIDGGECTPESYKHVLEEEYRMFLLPEIDEDLREIVKDIEPITIVKIIMLYTEMIVDAALANDINEITLGPDGGIYADDDVPYLPEDAEDQIMAATGLSPLMTEKMKQWVPLVSMQYNGLFPGMVACKDGFSSKVKIYDFDMAMKFSGSIAFLDGRETSIFSEDDILDIREMMQKIGIDFDIDDDDGMIRISHDVKYNEIEEAIRNTCTEGRKDEDIDYVRDMMTAVYLTPGTLITFDDLTEGLDEDRAKDVMSLMMDVIDSNRKNSSFLFACGSKGMTYLGNVGGDE
jgi:hypothetical protein